MLGINVNVKIDVKKPVSPIYFQHKNVCTHCGASGSLAFVDRFGRRIYREVNAFDHIECLNCGKNFSILWERDNNNKMLPSAVDNSVKTDFNNLLNFLDIKDSKVRDI